VLEVAAELVGRRDYPYQQARAQLRPQGPGDWTYTLFGSDAAESVDQVARREVDVAMINPSSLLTAAYRGGGPFAAPAPVRAIAVIPSLDWLGFAVLESTGLESLADIKRQRYPLRVSLRAQRDHSVHVYVDEVLKAYDFSLADIVSWGGDVAYDPGLPAEPGRIGRVERGEVDAIFDEALTRFIPRAVELGMRLLPLDEPILEHLGGMGLRRASVPKQQFPMLRGDVPTLDFSGWPLYTHADVAQDFIYDFCRALDARKERIPWQQPGPLPLEVMCRDTPAGPLEIPLHAGAERYWREVGYL
jgi:TRAP-type uncharacterized transport system substrate-binding protein